MPYAELKPARCHGKVKRGGLKMQAPGYTRSGANPAFTTCRLGGPSHIACPLPLVSLSVKAVFGRMKGYNVTEVFSRVPGSC